MMRNLVIADPGLISETGHHFHVSMNYAAAAREMGLTVRVIAHMDYAPATHDPLFVHGFTYNPYDPPRWLRPEIPRTLSGPPISTIAKDLLRVGPSLPLCEDTLVYFHSCSVSLINDVVDYFLVAPPSMTPVFMLRLIYEEDPSGASYPHWYLNQLRKKLRFSGLIGTKMFLSAETQALADQFTSILEVPCERIHHLATNRDNAATIGATSPDHVSLIFLGDARREKGIQLLPEVAKAIAADEELAGICELVVHAKASAIDATESDTVNHVKNELREHAGRCQVSFIESRLNDDAYNGLVNETDIALLLHDPIVYRTRGSAIYYDAALAGKCLIVREGSSMASERGLANIVVWKRSETFTDVLRRAIDVHAQLADGGLAENVAQLRNQCDPKKIIAHLISQMEGRSAVPLAPLAVQIMPAWFGEGSSQVFQAQTEYLANRGFRVVDVVVVTWDGAGEPEPEFYQRIFEGTQHHHSFFTFFMQRAPELGVVERRSLSSESYARLSYGFESKWLLDAEPPAGLARMVTGHEPALSLVNYAQYIPARGWLGQSKIVVEMHDLRSRQYAIERGSATAEARDIEQEIASALTADGIVFINEQEAGTFRSHCAQPFNGATAFPATRGEASSADATIALRRMLLETIYLASDQQRATLETFAWPGHGGPPRLMFVGSGHVSNTTSLDWFLAEVFLPRLLPLGLTLHVFGSIASRYRERVPGVVFYGRVQHIRPLYAFADIVVLPIRAGSGLPIKSVDAVRAGVPVVATSKAFEGIACAGDYLSFFDEPAAFADEVIRLTNDAAARAHLCQQVVRMGATVVDVESYYKALDGVVQQTGIVLPTLVENAALSEAALSELRMRRLCPHWDSVRPLLLSFIVHDQFLRLEFAPDLVGSPRCLTLRSDAAPLRVTIRVGDGPAALCASESGVASIMIIPPKGGPQTLELFAGGRNNFAATSRLQIEFTNLARQQSRPHLGRRERKPVSVQPRRTLASSAAAETTRQV